MKTVLRRTLSTSSKTSMRWSEVTAALRPFYLKVHPDLFMKHPRERDTNESSLKSLNSYLEALSKSKIPDHQEVNFFIKEQETLKKINLNLKGRGIVDTIKHILVSVDLPTIDLTLKETQQQSSTLHEEDEFGYRKTHEFHWTLHPDDLHSFQGRKEMGLVRFLEENSQSALERSLAAKPMREEVARVEAQVLDIFGLDRVTWDCGWGIAHYRAGLLALVNLRDHYPDIRDVLRGKILVFGQWTGVSLEGHIVLSSSEVRHNWLRFLRDVDEQLKFVQWVPFSEKSLSKELRGIKISHDRLNGRTLAFRYLVQVDKVTKSIQRWQWLNKFPDSLPEDLSAFTLVVENDAGPLMISQSGEIIIPSSCPAEIFVDFLANNLGDAKTAMEMHSSSIIEETDLREQLVHKFGLSELSKDETISSYRMVNCLRDILEQSDHLAIHLKDCHLRISNCYSILQDGILCIPAHWKL